jgi:uncharacterized damage-inducible protein DinB
MLPQLIKLFKDHFNGEPWLDINIIDTLKSINAQQAAFKNGDTNSIWQIVQHMIQWRNANLQRVQGIITPAPDNNFVQAITDVSDAAWQATQQALEESQKAILKFLMSTDEQILNKVYDPNGFTNYAHLQGLQQHDAYHLGQIVLLKKMMS